MISLDCQYRKSYLDQDLAGAKHGLQTSARAKDAIAIVAEKREFR